MRTVYICIIIIYTHYKQHTQCMQVQGYMELEVVHKERGATCIDIHAMHQLASRSTHATGVCGGVWYDVKAQVQEEARVGVVEFLKKKKRKGGLTRKKRKEKKRLPKG